MRIALTLLLVLGARAAAEELPRVAVLVGANDGASSDEPLRWANSDAARMRDLLVDLGGVRPDRALLVRGASRIALMRALNEARGRVAELTASGQAPLFIFYYSGHGDAGALHLRGEAMPLDELRAELERVPARLRVVIIDACRTGGRVKGVRAGPSFALPTVEETRGTVELNASAAGEAAQESEELGSAVFSHFIVSGLRGAADSDGDGRVTLLELYSYAYRRTLLRTSGSEVLQHPAWSANLAGTGELVLSFPSRAALRLELPPGHERYLVFNERSAAPMGEVSGEGRPHIALPPGRYVVTRRAPGKHALAVADGTWGGTVQLRASDFRTISEDQLYLRGGRLELHPWRVDVRLGSEWLAGAADAGAGRVGASVQRFRGPLSLMLEWAYMAADVATPSLVGVGHSLAAQAAIGMRLVRARLSCSMQLGAELRGTFERLSQRDAARAAAAGYPTAVSRDGLAGGPRLELSAGMALGHQLTGSLWGSALLLLRNEHDQLGHTQLAMRIGLGGGFALGRSF